MFVPVIELEIEPAQEAERTKLDAALAMLATDDPQFRVTIDAATRHMKLAGLDERQLDEKINVLRKAHNIAVTVGAPQVVYCEKITQRVEHEYTHKKQTGGSGQFAAIKIVAEPMASDTPFEFVNDIVAGAVPAEYIPSVERGLESVIGSGPLAGFQVVGLKVTLIDGKYHDVDSSALAFEICSRQCLREAMQKARPVLLEPIMRLAIEASESHASAIIRDLRQRRGRIEENIGTTITALVPAANLFGYASAVKQITGRIIDYTVRFDHYAPIPLDPPPFRPAVGMRA